MAKKDRKKSRKENGVLSEEVLAAVEEVMSKRKGKKEDATTDELVQAIEEALDGAKGKKSEDSELLTELVGTIIDEASDVVKSRKEDGTLEEVTLDVIEEVVEEIAAAKRRKGRKNDAATEDELKDLDTITEEDVVSNMAEAVAAIVEDSVDGENDEAVEDEPDTMKSDDEEDEGKNRKSKALKAANRVAQAKTGKSASQRKYADLFTGKSGRVEVKANADNVSPEAHIARVIKCLDVFGRGNPAEAAKAAIQRYGDQKMANEFKRTSGLNMTAPSEGGFLVPQTYVDELIQPLYNRLVFSELGVRRLPMPNGNLNIPKITKGSRAKWDGEMRKIAKDKPAYGNVKLSGKRLALIVPQSRELMMTASYSADEYFGSDLMMGMQEGMEYGGFFGAGTEFQPLGLANNKKIQQMTAAALHAQNPNLVDSSGVPLPDLFAFLLGTLMRTNIPRTYVGWVMDDMLFSVIYNMKTTTGDYLYRDALDQGQLMGYPIKTTNAIGIDNNGTTMLFFGDWNSLIIGDMAGIETFTTLEGSWIDDDGTSHNAFEENLSATRATMYVDFGMRYDEAMICLKGLKVE